MFSDLEMDYVNPIDMCRRLNMVSRGLININGRHPVSIARDGPSRPPHLSLPGLSSALALDPQWHPGGLPCDAGTTRKTQVGADRHFQRIGLEEEGGLCQVGLLSHFFLFLPRSHGLLSHPIIHVFYM